MTTLTFNCEVITPMFLGGANPTKTELRAASFKGALRFWWRAMNGHLSQTNLKLYESKIFGGVGKESRKSKMSIFIFDVKEIKASFQPLPHKHFRLEALGPGTTFKLRLTFQGPIQVPTDNYSFSAINLMSLFLAFSLLGGVGKRVRRGMGKFVITSIIQDNSDEEPFKFEFSPLSFKNLMNEVLPDGFDINGSTIISKKPPHVESKYPYIKEVQIGNPKPDLLWLISQKTSDHKAREPRRYNDAMGFASERKRLASPIFVSCNQNAKNETFPVITTLNAALENGNTPHYDSLQLQKKYKADIL